VAKLLLHIAFTNLGGGREARAQRMARKLLAGSASERSPRTPAAKAARLTSRATS